MLKNESVLPLSEVSLRSVVVELFSKFKVAEALERAIKALFIINYLNNARKIFLIFDNIREKFFEHSARSL